MGLDMYATTLKREVAESYNYKKYVSCDTRKWATRAVGFIYLTEDEVNKLTPESQRAYHDKRSEAVEQASREGYINTHFAYWRKFNHLHGWMERLYQERGGVDTFNCIEIWLDEEAIDRLEKEKDSLEPTQGFFFGSYEELTKEDKEEIQEFIERCRQAFADGYVVFYDSWW